VISPSQRPLPDKPATLTRGKHQWPGRNSNPQSQQASGRGPTAETAQSPASAMTVNTWVIPECHSPTACQTTRFVLWSYITRHTIALWGTIICSARQQFLLNFRSAFLLSARRKWHNFRRNVLRFSLQLQVLKVCNLTKENFSHTSICAGLHVKCHILSNILSDFSQNMTKRCQ